MPRAKKNNRRKGPKVTRRPNTYRMKRAFTDDSVRLSWDVTKTPAMNYEAMRLQRDPNTTAALEDAKAGAVLVDIDEVRALAAAVVPQEVRRPEHWVSEEEAAYLQRCAKVHGDDFRKMARDIKTNYMQHTQQHLETRMRRLKLFLEAKSSAAAK